MTIPAWMIGLVGMSGAAVSAIVASLLMRRLAGSHRECRQCGYPSIGAPGPVCPECGADWRTRGRVPLGRRLRIRATSVLFIWMSAAAIVVALLWPSITGVMPWEYEYVAVDVQPPARPPGRFDDGYLIVTCRARTRTGWFSANETLRRFDWDIDARKPDGSLLAQLTGSETEGLVPFNSAGDSSRALAELNAETLGQWLQDTFPHVNRQSLERCANGIVMTIERRRDTPQLMSGPPTDLADSPWAAYHPALNLAGRIGTTVSQPSCSAVALTLGVTCALWIAGGVVILVVCCTMLRRRIKVLYTGPGRR